MLKLEYLVGDREEWIVVDPITKITSMLKEFWDHFEWNLRSIIELSLLASTLFNVTKECIIKKRWDILGVVSIKFLSKLIVSSKEVISY